MAKEIIINGKPYRYYIAGRIYVAEDGLEAYKSDNTGTIKRLYVQTKPNGYKYILDGKNLISMAGAVITCFCPPKPNDGKKYFIEHIDGNPSNCNKRNLKWSLQHYQQTTAESVKLKRGTDEIIVKQDGTILLNGQKETICDYQYDSDINLHDCIRPHIKTGVLSNKRVFIDDLMDVAGYVQGDDAILNNPVILHRDYDRMNFSSNNLEWVESTDIEYQKYMEKQKNDIHKRRIELNPGLELPSYW